MKSLKDLGEIEAKLGNSPLVMANFAKALLSSRTEHARARELCAKARAMAPEDGEVRAICAEIESAGVPQWYATMVQDSVRHRAYAQAFNRVLGGGGVVLDIGAGTGLFAMMAARAGADRVIACERNVAVAEVAQEVVRANGLENVIVVLPKASTDTIIGREIGDRVDVLVWDNLSNDLIGAGALPVVEDAFRRLLSPGGTVIPGRARIRVAMAEHGGLDRRRLSVAEGFDLAAFNKVTRARYTVGAQDQALCLRSTPASLFEFDFNTGGPFPAQRTVMEVAGIGGLANGLVQWLEFDIDDHEQYSTAPGLDVWAFGLEFHPMLHPMEAAVGEAFRIAASHDRQNLRIWLEDDG